MIIERTLSGFHLSAGTGLAFESLFVPTETVLDTTNQAKPVNTKNYNIFYISIFTLLRNILNAIPSSTNIYYKDVYDTLLDEMNIIRTIALTQTPHLSVRFYWCSYKTARSVFTHQSVKLRTNNTPKQKMTEILLNQVINKLLKEKDDEFLMFNSDILERDSSSKTAIVLTSQAYDLLSYKYFHSLDLLESHTRLIKTRALWYSKYKPVGNEDMSRLPFLKMLLMVMGDNYMYLSMPIELRRIIVATSHARKWNAFTTRDKILLDLSLEISEPMVMQVLKSLK